jgi:hypothetical protein
VGFNANTLRKEVTMRLVTWDKVDGKLVRTVMFEGTEDEAEEWLKPRREEDNPEFGRVYSYEFGQWID